MEQSIWTYRDPAPTKTLDTKGIMSLIADYLKGPAERPLMLWCHNNPSIDRLYQYLHNYKREDGAMLFTISCPVIESSYRLVLVDGKAKEIDGNKLSIFRRFFKNAGNDIHECRY